MAQLTIARARSFRHPYRTQLRPGALAPDARQDRAALPTPRSGLLGRALCPDCYDYPAAVMFNAYAGTLWKRFTTYLPRHLARLAGLTHQAFRHVAFVVTALASQPRATPGRSARAEPGLAVEQLPGDV